MALRLKRTWHLVGLPVVEDSHAPFLWLGLASIVFINRARRTHRFLGRIGNAQHSSPQWDFNFRLIGGGKFGRWESATARLLFYCHRGYTVWRLGRIASWDGRKVAVCWGSYLVSERLNAGGSPAAPQRI